MVNLKNLKSLQKYLFQLYQKHPYLMMSIETATLMGTGDIIAQSLIPQKKDHNFDPQRFFTFAGIGLFVVGPSVSRWYYFLERKAQALNIGKKSVEALGKVVADQLVFAPTFMAVVLLLVDVLSGKNREDIEDDFRDKYIKLLMANYKVWPLFQFINFYIIPLRWQLIANQSIAIFWNTYLSYRLFPEEELDKFREAQRRSERWW